VVGYAGVIDMKIMSFNTQHCLNYLQQRVDFDIMARAIQTCGADIVGLNEMYNESENPQLQDQVGKLARKTGLPYHYFAQAISIPNGTYGNGIISRWPIVSAETILVPEPPKKDPPVYYERRCLLKAKLANGLTVLVIHFGLSPEEQENAAATVLEHLEDEKCILMGDFNILPDNPLLTPIRARMKDTADLFESPRLSCPSDNPTVKIDYIFVSPDITVECADIPAIVASDHRPHTAQVR